MRYTFKKHERLCSRKLLGELSEKGHSFFVYPFKVMWMLSGQPDRETGNSPVQVTMAVSKRKLGSAILRNTIRRRMREAWRKNKHLLYSTPEKKRTPDLSRSSCSIAVLLLYTLTTESDYALIEQKIILSLQRLKKDIGEL